jgi:hypothetical protein
MVKVKHEITVVRGDGFLEDEATYPSPVRYSPALVDQGTECRAFVRDLDLKVQGPLRDWIS